MPLTHLEQRQELEQRLALSLTLAPLVEQRQALSQMIAEFQEQKDALSVEIGTQMVREGLLKLDVELPNGTTYGASYTPDATRNTLNELKLIENGVGTDVIAKSKVVTMYSKLDIREKKAKS